MKVSLNQELEKFIEEKVQRGKYHSASEVISEGLRLLVERDRINQMRLEALCKEIAIGLEASQRGEVIDGEEAFAEIDEEIRQIFYCPIAESIEVTRIVSSYRDIEALFSDMGG